MFGLLLPCRKVDRYIAYLHSAIKNDSITIRLCLLGAQDETFSQSTGNVDSKGLELRLNLSSPVKEVLSVMF